MIDADVCIVGAGVAGLALAGELDRAGLDTLLVESAGRPGGGGHEWAGRLAPYDPIDFEHRPWVPLSGWPLPAGEVLGRVPRAARFFGLERPSALVPERWCDDEVFAQLGSDALSPGVQLWPRRPWRPRSRGTRFELNAEARRLVAGADGTRIEAVEVARPDGSTSRIVAREYVLACGGLENPRVLLRSGVGNDAVGRHLMDHARTDGVARLHLEGASWKRLTEHRSERAEGRVQFCVRPSEALQRREQLLNACTFLYPVSGPRAALRRVARWPRRIDRLDAVDQVEHVPDPASRVTLEGVDLRIGEATTRTLRRLHGLLAERVAEAGLGRLRSALLDDPTLVPAYTDAAHPMGATRMSADPRHGVVDADCRVHGVANLHVAGSSVFPTGGQAPPTLTIVCLALRLADALIARDARARSA